MTDYQAIIAAACLHSGLDPALVGALVEVESASNPWAVRYEPQYRWLLTPETFALELRVSVDTERTCQRCSWGLMQVMGAIARERGFRGRYLSALCDPQEGLRWGIAQLRWLRETQGFDGDDLIAAYAVYNGGVGAVRQAREQGTYPNAGYVAKVKRALARPQATA